MFGRSLGSVIRVVEASLKCGLLCALSSLKSNQSQKDPFLSQSNLNANLVVALINQTLQCIL